MAYKIFGVLFFFLILAGFATNTRASRAPASYKIDEEISVDGPAIFYAISDDQRKELWSVTCLQPLRGCVAKAHGFVLRLDSERKPWLIAAAGPKTRISIQSRNFTQDSPNLLTRPLDPETIDKLSDSHGFIVIEEEGFVLLRTRTSGLAHVISYLTWVSGNIARTLRDARQWPRDGKLQIQNMTPEVLERYEVMQKRALEAQRQLVPSTKPQVEFSSRAQGGNSFFSATGIAGY